MDRTQAAFFVNSLLCFFALVAGFSETLVLGCVGLYAVYHKDVNACTLWLVIAAISWLLDVILAGGYGHDFVKNGLGDYILTILVFVIIIKIFAFIIMFLERQDMHDPRAFKNDATFGDSNSGAAIASDNYQSA